jgi:hypothetical protein
VPAINWFEVFLSTVVAEVPVERLNPQAPAPKRRKSIEYRTLLETRDDSSLIYHITVTPSIELRLEEVNFEEHPSVAKLGLGLPRLHGLFAFKPKRLPSV